jgi:hypothetical protein
MNEEISFGKVIAEDLLGVGNLENTTEITQVNKAKTIRAESKTLFFMNGRFDCPHCSKGIYFEVEKELNDDEVTPKETSCGEIKMDKEEYDDSLDKNGNETYKEDEMDFNYRMSKTIKRKDPNQLKRKG